MPFPKKLLVTGNRGLDSLGDFLLDLLLNGTQVDTSLGQLLVL